MNKILVPLKNMDFLDALISAGADEFYMGFRDEGWVELFGDYAEINRMSGFKESANRYTFEEALENIKTIVSKNKAIFITMNSASYSSKKLERLKYYFEKIKEAGASGVIVSTPEEVMLAKEVGINAVASTLCAIYNEYTSEFYNSLGSNRQILPRDMSLEEIEGIVKKEPNIEFEVFLMRNGCQFSDSHCLGFHRKEFGSVCMMVNHSQKSFMTKDRTFMGRHNLEFNNILYSNFYHRAAACGLCALYRFVKLNISAYKIVGRNDNPEEVCRDIELVRKNIEIAKKCNSEEEYLEKMIMPGDVYNGCKKGLGCYYPEIRF